MVWWNAVSRDIWQLHELEGLAKEDVQLYANEKLNNWLFYLGE